MKPTPQLSSNDRNPQSVPVVEYNYHSTLETARPTVEQKTSALEQRPFWKLTGQVLGPKTTAEYVRELIAFVVITALAAWPIVTVAVAITRMVRNY